MSASFVPPPLPPIVPPESSSSTVAPPNDEVDPTLIDARETGKLYINLAADYADSEDLDESLRQLKDLTITKERWWKLEDDGGRNVWAWMMVCYGRVLYRMEKYSLAKDHIEKGFSGLRDQESKWGQWVRGEGEKVLKLCDLCGEASVSVPNVPQSSFSVGSDAPSTMSAHTTPTKPQGDIIMRSSTPPMPRGKSPELVPPPSSPSSPLLSRSTRPESSPASRSPIPPPQLSEAEEEVYLISEETSALLKSEEVWKKEQDEFRAREGEEFDGAWGFAWIAVEGVPVWEGETAKEVLVTGSLRVFGGLSETDGLSLELDQLDELGVSSWGGGFSVPLDHVFDLKFLAIYPSKKIDVTVWEAGLCHNLRISSKPFIDEEDTNTEESKATNVKEETAEAGEKLDVAMKLDEEIELEDGGSVTIQWQERKE